MRKVFAALALLCIVPSVSRAAEIFEKVGTFDGQFLKIGFGARAAGMGGAFVAVSDDASSLFWNCAGLARIDPDKSQVQLDHANWPGDLNFDVAAYAFHFKRIPGAFGLQARALSMNPMVETDSYHPDPTVGTGRTFDAGMMLFGLTYARSYTDKFSAGVTANYVQEGLAEFSQSTFTFDVGTLYDVGTLGMRIGMGIQNIGSQIKFIDREARMPAIFRVGASANLISRAQSKLLGSFEFSHPPDNSERLNAGMEYQFHNFAFLRGGYYFNYDAESWAAGAGFNFPVSSAGHAKLDYAFTEMGDLGGVNRFTVQFQF